MPTEIQCNPALTLHNPPARVNSGTPSEHLHNPICNSTKQTKNLFPLNNLFARLEEKDGWTKGFKGLSKQFLMMFSNLLPALTVNEAIGSIGTRSSFEKQFDFLIRPATAIFTRQTIVDGINKKNVYKPIAASISAIAMLKAQQAFGLPKFLLRPLLAVFMFAIQEFNSIKQLIGIKSTDTTHNKNNDCKEKHDHDHKPEWGKLSAGLGVIELQLNTVAPIVDKISSFIFKDTSGLISSIGKVLFNSTALSAGFTGIGELLVKGINKLSKNFEWLKQLAVKIEAIICPCCGATGACANTIAEDITATSSYSIVS